MVHIGKDISKCAAPSFFSSVLVFCNLALAACVSVEAGAETELAL